MDVEKVKKYVGKKVLLILNNGFKFTTVIPEFVGESFSITDKFGKDAEITCSMIDLIYDRGEYDEV